MKKIIILLLAVLMIGCAKEKEVIRIVVQEGKVNGVNYIMVCEKVDGHIESETCMWHNEDFTPAPFEYYVPDIPLLGSPLGIRKV